METVEDSTPASGASRPRRRFPWWIVAVVAVAAAAGYLWWRAASRHPQYVTAAVTRGTVRRSVSMTGALNPVVTVQVGSYVSGPVKSLGCDFNTEVVVGQLCATIDPVPFQLVVDQDRAEVGTSQAQLKKDQAAMVYAKIAFERDSKLLAEGTVAQDTVDNDQSVYEQAKAQIGLDQATIVNKVATLKAAEVNLAYTNIVSPVIGTVITRNVDVGQTVAASLTAPTLFLIGKDLTKMQVDTNVSEADVGLVRLGQEALFTVQAFPARTFRGKVTQVRRGPITVQNVVTYDAVVAVNNPDRLLFPGMTADTHIVIDEHDNVLRVPLPAVRFTPEGIGRERHGSRGAGGGAEGGERSRAEGGGAEPRGEQQGEAVAAGTAVPAAPPEAASTGGEERVGGAGQGGPGGRGGEDGSEGKHHRRREAGAEGPGGDQGGPGGSGSWHRRSSTPDTEPGSSAEGASAGEGRRGPHGEGSHKGGGEGRQHPGGEERQQAGGEGSHKAGGEGGFRGRGEGRPEAGGGAGRGGARGEGRQGGGGFGPSVVARRARVWVLQADGSLRPVDVITGIDDGTLIEVSGKGLSPGDKVVVNEIKPDEQRQRNGPPNPNQNQVLRQGGQRL